MNRQFDNRFDELFNEKFSGFEKTPPDYILNNVMNSVMKQSLLGKIGSFYRNNLLISGISIIVPAIIIGFYAFTGGKPVTEHRDIPVTQINTGLKTTTDHVNTEETRPVSRNMAGLHEKPAPLYNHFESCGLTCKMKARGNSGKWTCNTPGVVFSVTGNECSVSVPVEGAYLFEWIPDDGFKSNEHFNVKFRNLPESENPGQITCCTNEVTVVARKGARDGYWSSVENVTFRNPGDLSTTAMYQGTGKVRLVWTEKSGCAFSDTFHVFFPEKADAAFDLVSKVKCPGEQLLFEAKNKGMSKYEWEIDGGAATDLSAAAVHVTWTDGPGHTITLKTWTKENCFSSYSSFIEIPKPIDVDFEVKESVCAANGSIKVVTQDPACRFFWMNDVKPSGTVKNDLAPGTYNVTVRDNAACSKTYSVEVPGMDNLKASFYHSNYELTPPSTVYFVNTSTVNGSLNNRGEDVKYEWDFGDGSVSGDESPNHTYSNSGTYHVRLTVRGKDGCSDTYSVSDINIDPSHLAVPNVFSPNGDGRNDVFKVNAAALDELHVIITGIRGEKVYDWTDPEAGWDGTILKSGVKAAPGYYIYIVTATGKDGSRFQDKGTVQLVRD